MIEMKRKTVYLRSYNGVLARFDVRAVPLPYAWPTGIGQYSSTSLSRAAEYDGKSSNHWLNTILANLLEDGHLTILLNSCANLLGARSNLAKRDHRLPRLFWLLIFDTKTTDTHTIKGILHFRPCAAASLTMFAQRSMSS